MKKKVLWIEDQAELDLAALAGPVYTSGEYFLDVAGDASDAWEKIKKNEYDVIIVDIRIPPGDAEAFHKYFIVKGHNKNDARLGIQLLYLLLCPEKNSEKDIFNRKLENIPSWLSKEKFGILTVETEADVEKDRVILGINTYRRKEGISKKTILLDLIKEVVNQNKIK
ncbi:MAG: response regulator [Bacteroidales bacterium]|nr:response regulator [Bacteroidales bacterium]